MRYRVSFTIPHEYVTTIMEVMHGVGADFHFAPIPDGAHPTLSDAASLPVIVKTHARTKTHTVKRHSRGEAIVKNIVAAAEGKPFRAIDVATMLSDNGLSPTSSGALLSKHVREGTLIRNKDGTYQVPTAA